MKLKIIKRSFWAFFLLPAILCAQPSLNTLQGKLHHILDTAGGKFGVGVLGVDFDAGFVMNGEGKYLMQSVFKFPLALAILNQVDKGTLSLNQKFHMKKDQLDANTWSPMLTDSGYRNIDISLSQLLIYAVSKSDNNACDFLFEVAGGTAKVNHYVNGLGIKDISIVFTEKQMGKDWSFQYQNWCKPGAMLQLLRLFFDQKILSKTSNDFLMKCMTEVPDWPKRITLRLPAGTPLVHKSGTSGTNDKGMLAATNDVGILTLPNGKHLAIVVFASDYKGPRERGERIIGDLCRSIWDFYTSDIPPPFFADIQRFKHLDSLNRPPANAILFVGSSSFTKWTDVQDYFPGYAIINRGFGGSTLLDVDRYYKDIIVPYNPKQVVVYCGENDLAYSDSVSAMDVLNRFKALFTNVRRALPDVPITYISIKPSPSRVRLREKFVLANAHIKTFLSSQSNTSYVDVYIKMMDIHGSINKAVFLSDSLHMKPQGYKIWQEAILPYLLK